MGPVDLSFDCGDVVMNKALSIVLLFAFTAGCEPLADDARGEVVEFSDNMVVIQSHGAGFHQDDYKSANTAMTAQAQELCASRKRNAKFLSADLKDTGARTVYGPLGTTYISGSSTIAPVLYRFACI
jgi:hypothetical protein